MLFFWCVNPVFGLRLRESPLVSYRFEASKPMTLAPRSSRRMLVAVGVLAALGCAPRTPPASARPHVLLVTIDTLRADHVGCYGYRAAVTPTLDGLAARGVRFAVAVAHAPLTAV